MAGEQERIVAVTGATGRQGGAVTRSLLAAGWRVRAITRKPDGKKAHALERLGAEVIRADLSNPASLRRAFHGAYGVFSVQSPAVSGADSERVQGRAVAEVAQESGVRHVVYASAGPGHARTGVRQWDDKLDVEAHMRRLGLAHTILRPMALMELMTDAAFFPAASTWYAMAAITGPATPIPWIAARDVGEVTALVFADPPRFASRELRLASDVKSLDECREIYREVLGRAPRRFPMPVWLLRRFAGSDVIRMWRWLSTNAVDVDVAETRALLPHALDVRSYLLALRPTPHPGAGDLRPQR